MTFDPFGDFDKQGYLRNLAKEKDSDIVRRLEHASFTTGIDGALIPVLFSVEASSGLSPCAEKL